MLLTMHDLELKYNHKISIKYMDASNLELKDANGNKVYRIYRLYARGTLVDFGMTNLDEVEDAILRIDNIRDGSLDYSDYYVSNSSEFDELADGILAINPDATWMSGNQLKEPTIRNIILKDNGYTEVSFSINKGCMVCGLGPVYGDTKLSLSLPYAVRVFKGGLLDPYREKDMNYTRKEITEVLTQEEVDASGHNIYIEPELAEDTKVEIARAKRKRIVIKAAVVAAAGEAIYGYKKALHPHVAPVMKSLKDETARQVGELKAKVMMRVEALLEGDTDETNQGE